MHKRTNNDYRDPRFLEAPIKAAKILIKHKNSWNSVIDAYWLLRRHEDEIGIPVTYDIVEKAYTIAIKELGARHKVYRVDLRSYEASSVISSGEASTSNM